MSRLRRVHRNTPPQNFYEEKMEVNECLMRQAPKNNNSCQMYPQTLAQRVNHLEDEVCDINIALSEQACELNNHNCRISELECAQQELECRVRQLECEEKCPKPCNPCDPCNPCEPKTCEPMPMKPPIIFDGYSASYRLVFTNGCPTPYWFIAPDHCMGIDVYRFSWKQSANKYIYEPVDPNNYSCVFPPSSTDGTHITYLYEYINSYGWGLRPYIYTAQNPTNHTIIGYQYIPITFTNPSSTEWCYVPNCCVPLPCPPAPCQPEYPCEPKPCEPKPCEPCYEQNDCINPCNPCKTSAETISTTTGDICSNPDVTLINQPTQTTDSAKSQWAAKISGAAGEYGYFVTTDSEQNVIITGEFRTDPTSMYNSDGTLGKSIPNTSGSIEAYVTKYTPDGKVIWSTRIISASSFVVPKCVQVDSNDNIVVVGHYQNTIEFFNANGASKLTTATYDAGHNSFVVKYDKFGNRVWDVVIAGEEVMALSVAIDSYDEISVVGTFAENSATPIAFFDPTGTSSQTFTQVAGPVHTFVVKYDIYGGLLWKARLIAATLLNPQVYGRSVTTDSANSVIFVGNYIGTLEIRDYTDAISAVTVPSSLGKSNCYVVKYSSAGVPTWATYAVGATGNIPQTANCVTTDSSDNIFVAGVFTDPVFYFYNPNNITAVASLTIDGVNNVFLAKYNSSGSVLAVNKIGGTGITFLGGIDLTSNNEIVVGGGSSSVALQIYNPNNTTAVTQIIGDGQTHGFLIKYDSTLTYKWNTMINGTAADVINSVAVDKKNNVLITGVFNISTLNFYDSGSTTVARTLVNGGVNTNDGFVAKYADHVQTLEMLPSQCAYQLKTIAMGTTSGNNNTLINISDSILLDSNGKRVIGLLFTASGQTITLLWHNCSLSIISNNGVTLLY